MGQHREAPMKTLLSVALLATIAFTLAVPAFAAQPTQADFDACNRAAQGAVSSPSASPQAGGAASPQAGGVGPGGATGPMGSGPGGAPASRTTRGGVVRLATPRLRRDRRTVGDAVAREDLRNRLIRDQHLDRAIDGIDERRIGVAQSDGHVPAEVPLRHVGLGNLHAAGVQLEVPADIRVGDEPRDFLTLRERVENLERAAV